MRKYFYVNESVRFGPVSYQDLKSANITAETLVWFDGLTEWRVAGEIPELTELFGNTVEEEESFEEISTIGDSLYKNVEQHLLPVVGKMSNEQIIIDPDHQGTLEIVEVTTPFDRTEPMAKRPGMFSSPFSFSGRIRRTEYWLTCIAINIAFVIIGEMMANASPAGVSAVLLVFYLPCVWLIIAQNAKRCHDRGNSGWFQIIPFYGLWMAFGAGDPYSNEYGSNPKG